MAKITDNLVGIRLDNGWVIVSKKPTPPISSGGNFSVGYIVKKDNEEAFLKVLDITRAFRFPDFTVVLENLLKAHNYECELLEACQNKRLSKIVRVLDKGQIILPDDGSAILIPPIPYIIFEKAETTSREMLNVIDQFDLAFALRSLHNVAVGLNQLHGIGIVHQDTKPSNVLHFEKTKEHKLGDLGRGDGGNAPHAHSPIAGDPSYAPPEHLYQHISPDRKTRRQACDTYHLGSLLMFYFTHTDTTSLIKSNLASDYHWNNWGGAYKEVLPYLYEAFDKSVGLFTSVLEQRISDKRIVEELEWSLRRLCDPDPEKRGHPKDISSVGSSYTLTRFITIFNKWATIFEVGFK